MKIILKNAGAQFTSHNSKYRIQIFDIAVTYKEVYPLNVELQKLVRGDRNRVTLVQYSTLVSAVGLCLEPGRSNQRMSWK